MNQWTVIGWFLQRLCRINARIGCSAYIKWCSGPGYTCKTRDTLGSECYRSCSHWSSVIYRRTVFFWERLKSEPFKKAIRNFPATKIINNVSSILTRTMMKDNFLKKFHICLKIVMKISCLILFLSNVAADDQGQTCIFFNLFYYCISISVCYIASSQNLIPLITILRALI